MIPDIITSILFAAGCIVSWVLFRRKHYRGAVLLLMGAGLALRMFTAGDLYLHKWDERYHALVAKNMISHPLTPTLCNDPVMPYDYRDWSYNHIWVHKQPAPLWGMAASMALFGTNEIALRLPSVLFTTLGIWLIFVIGSYFFDPRTGFLAAFFFAINGLILELAGGRIPTDHIDTFFLFFVELAVFFTILFAGRGKTIFNILAGVSIGLAILSKWMPALIVLPVWILLVKESGKFPLRAIVGQFILLAVVVTAVFLPWQIYIFRAFPLEASWESSVNLRHIREVLEHNSGPFYFYLDKMRINYGELVYIPLVWFIVQLWKRPKDLQSWALAVWLFVPLIFFSSIKTKMQGYILFTAPVLFILTAAFFFRLSDWKRKVKYPAIVTILLILFIVLPLRYSIERSKLFVKTERNPEWVKELRAMGGNGTNSGTVLFNYSRPVEAMFYTGMTAYRDVPDPNTIRNLQARGYKIIVNDNGHLPGHLKELTGVEYRRFRTTD